ncbi:MAG: diadenylate cyclase CdaA [Bacteroidales bacterium]|nr:diadenylate cyclase CdaA [Bacteroidales bacterium]
MTILFLETIRTFSQSIRIRDVIDLLLVAALIFEMFFLMRKTVGIRILIGFILMYFLWRAVVALDMLLLSKILGAFMGVGAIALVIVFQPEIRQILLMLGNVKMFERVGKGKWSFIRLNLVNDKLNIDAIVMACKKMSSEKTGALIVIARYNELEQVMKTGIAVDATVNEQLLESIFFKNSPLHDGAVIISHNRIATAKAILPVSSNRKIPTHFGLRHRSALGMSENTDAIIVVVSEETGKISLFHRTNIIQNLSSAQLGEYLRNKFEPKNVKK